MRWLVLSIFRDLPRNLRIMCVKYFRRVLMSPLLVTIMGHFITYLKRGDASILNYLLSILFILNFRALFMECFLFVRLPNSLVGVQSLVNFDTLDRGHCMRWGVLGRHRFKIDLRALLLFSLGQFRLPRLNWDILTTFTSRNFILNFYYLRLRLSGGIMNILVILSLLLWRRVIWEILKFGYQFLDLLLSLLILLQPLAYFLKRWGR